MLSAMLHCAHDNLRILQCLFYGLPHNGLNGTPPGSPATAKCIMERRWSKTVITVLLPITALPTPGAATLPTAETGVTEQVLELAIAPAHPCIVLLLYLRCSKCLLIDDGRHRNRKPFLFRLQAMPRLFVWIIRAGVIFHFPVVQCAVFCFIRQNEKNGRGLPGPYAHFA